MCLILFGVAVSSDIPLVVAANRDEFYARPTEGAHFWDAEGAPRANGVLAGRDLKASGTWLGVTRSGRFAAVTNFSDPAEDAPASRGALVQGFLESQDTAIHFAHHIDGPMYRGFNLLLWDGKEMVYTSNKAPTQVLEPGYYGLSNAELGAKWYKAERGKATLREVAERLEQLDEDASDALRGLLTDESLAPDHQLPNRPGRNLDIERRTSACFIRGDDYGTRASTSVLIQGSELSFSEQQYGVQGKVGELRRFKLDLSEHSTCS